MTKISSDDILESVYKFEYASLINSKLNWNRRYRCPSIRNLKTMVKRSVDQKLRLRNFHAKHEKIESGAVVKNRKGVIGVDGEKGICYQWKEISQCSKRD